MEETTNVISTSMNSNHVDGESTIGQIEDNTQEWLLPVIGGGIGSKKKIF